MTKRAEELAEEVKALVAEKKFCDLPAFFEKYGREVREACALQISALIPLGLDRETAKATLDRAERIIREMPLP
jgi:hypothetical protein